MLGYLAQAIDEAIPDGAAGFPAAQAVAASLNAAGFVIVSKQKLSRYFKEGNPMKAKASDERETLALIRMYGEKLSYAGHGTALSASRDDLIEWGERIVALAQTLPKKNSLFLREPG